MRRPETLCPVSLSTALIGDRWSLLLVRELVIGPARFQDLQAQTGAASQLLSARLKRLQATGIVEKQTYQTRPPRHKYYLSEKGAALIPVLQAFQTWGQAWNVPGAVGTGMLIVHRSCGTEVGPDGICCSCRRRLAWSELAGKPTLAYQLERMARSDAYRHKRGQGCSQSAGDG